MSYPLSKRNSRTGRYPTFLFLAVALAAATVAIAGCGSPAEPATPTAGVKGATPPSSATAAVAAPTAAAAATTPSAPAPTTASTAASGGGSGTTAGQLADAGKPIYASSCASCHGEQGQGITGPTLIGSNAHYGRFQSAKELHDYIATAMPMDNPGSLSPEQNMQVTAFILVQNGFVQPTAPLSSNTLGSVQLKP